MKIIPTQFVAGCPVGQECDVEDDYAGWLVANGYAIKVNVEKSGKADNDDMSEANDGDTPKARSRSKGDGQTRSRRTPSPKRDDERPVTTTAT